MAFTPGIEVTFPIVEFSDSCTVIGSEVFTPGGEIAIPTIDSGISCLGEGAKVFTNGLEFLVPSMDLGSPYTKVNTNKVFGIGNILFVYGLPYIAGDTGIIISVGLYFDFEVNNRSPELGEWVTFHSLAPVDLFVSFSWDLDDGKESSKVQPSTYYLKTGFKTIEASVVSINNEFLTVRKVNYIQVVPAAIMNFIDDYPLRSQSLLIEQVKKQYGADSTSDDVLSESGTDPLPSPPAEPGKITDLSVRASSLINENVRRQYGEG